MTFQSQQNNSINHAKELGVAKSLSLGDRASVRAVNELLDLLSQELEKFICHVQYDTMSKIRWV